MKQADSRFLAELMEKRNQMMENKNDEYIDIPFHGISNQENKISESIGRLNETVKHYYESQKTGKMKNNLCNYVVFLVSVSGLLVLNDYIIITYFV